MITNQKLKIVLIGEKGSKKLNLLQLYLSSSSAESKSFIETHCMIGILKQDQNLFHYKTFDLKLNKTSKIISNTFFPEIHALVFISPDPESLRSLLNLESSLITLLHPQCCKVLVHYSNSLDSNLLTSFQCPPKYSFFSVNSFDMTTVVNLFDWIIFKLSETFEVYLNLGTGIQLERNREGYQECC